MERTDVVSLLGGAFLEKVPFSSLRP
jgi:hypothetical protein